MIKLIVGLGNPGAEYLKTRHNAGFWLVDALCRQYGIEIREEARFFGQHARAVIHGQTVSLLKPSIFMNRSGRSIGACASFYRLDVDQIVVAHDELDLDPGVVRFKTGGGHGGHNGLRDTISHLGERGFHRLRIGIGHPGSAARVVSYVLSRPNAAEETSIRLSIDHVLDHVPEIVQGKYQIAMNSLHQKSDKLEK